MRRAFVFLVAAFCPTPAFAQTFPSSAGNLSVQTIARGLDHPWGLAFLPDGRMLVTERPGRMRIVTADGKLSPPIGNVPHVRAAGQGGLHDVLCTATHFVADCVGHAVERFLPEKPARLLLSGGGVRNGLLWKFLEQRLPGLPLPDCGGGGAY